MSVRTVLMTILARGHRQSEQLSVTELLAIPSSSGSLFVQDQLKQSTLLLKSELSYEQCPGLVEQASSNLSTVNTSKGHESQKVQTLARVTKVPETWHSSYNTSLSSNPACRVCLAE